MGESRFALVGLTYWEVLVLAFSISVECMNYFQGSWLQILCGCLLCQFLPEYLSIIRDFPRIETSFCKTIYVKVISSIICCLSDVRRGLSHFLMVTTQSFPLPQTSVQVDFSHCGFWISQSGSDGANSGRLVQILSQPWSKSSWIWLGSSWICLYVHLLIKFFWYMISLSPFSGLKREVFANILCYFQV